MSSSTVLASRTAKSTAAIADRSTIKNTVDIELKIVEGRDLSDSHRLNFKPSYFVEVEVGQDKQRTSVRQKEKESTKWDESFMFAANLSSCLNVRIYCHHEHVRADHVIGEVRLDLLKQSRNQIIDLDLHAPVNATATSPTPKKLRGRLTLFLRVSILATFSCGAEGDLDLGSIQSLETFGFIKSLTPEQFQKISPPWKRFMTSLKTFCILAAAIAELSPKAKVAFGAVSFAIMVMINQVTRDDKIQGLIDIMNDLYYFFLDANPMQKILSFKKTVDRLLFQTTECSYFIAEYLKTASVARRALLHMVSNADAMIAQFEGGFGDLKIELILGTSLQTAAISFRILNKVKSIENLMYIDQLPYSRSAGWDLRRTCLRGTRQAIIDDLVRWACDTRESEESRFYLLSGPPGCGKSAIAHTVSQIFHQQGRLGAAVFLDSRCVDREVNSQTVSSTIAFQLASYDTRIKARMAARLSSGNHLASADVERQFPKLVVASLKDLTIVGPIVIVIDGLSDPAEQRRLLTTILNSSTHLPSKIRLLLTSRHDPMIAMLEQTREISFQDSREPILGLETPSDYIYRCLDDHIFSKASFSDKYNRRELHDQMVRQAMNMDFWISLICRILSACSNSEKTILLDIIQAYEPPRSKEEAMDHIYHAFLAILPYPTALAHSIFDAFINSPQPLSWPNPGILGAILVERSLDSRGSPLYGIHPSFEDFLTDRGRVGSHDDEYYVDRQQVGSAGRPRVCLEEMNHSLKHNLFDLELMALNHEAVDKLANIRQSVPGFLQYACCNWIRHIEAVVDINDAAEVMTALRTFLFAHLLHWFEVMSLLGFLDTILPSLERLAAWLKERASKEWELREITGDGIHFIRTFSPIISQSVMQTYISALPLMPSDTLLFSHYRKEYIAGRSNLTSYTRHPTRWEASVSEKTWVTVSKQFTFASSVAHQGCLIARYNALLGIAVYDVRRGQIGTVLDTGPLSTMAFSPDGEQIVTTAGNGSIGIWEVKTGKRVKIISSDLRDTFVRYSSDGTRIVIIGRPIHSPHTSEFYKSMVWDAATDSCKAVEEFNLTISGAVALSGRQLAVTQQSKTRGTRIGILQIGAESKDEERLHAATGSEENVSGALETATELRNLPGIEFSGLIWSPDGHLLAASLDKGAICLWSVGHGSTPRLTLQLPTKEAIPPKNLVTLWRVAFSWDSLYIASIHTFSTTEEGKNVQISVWDTKVGGLRFRKEFKASLRFPSISFLPDSYDIFVHLDPRGTPPPIHLVSSTNPSIPFESNALTVQYSHLTSELRSPPNGHVDSNGWICNTAGERQMWVPYPNYQVASEHIVPYSGGEGSQCQILEVKHPETKEVVLRFEISLEHTPESETSEESSGEQ